jgi:hypothetical protein
MASKPARLVVAIAVWAVAATGGLYAVTAHGAAAGQSAEAPAHVRASGRASIVVAAHPECPCTRATLHELNRIASEHAGAADITILFAGHASGDRVARDLRELANAIPNAHVVDDPDRTIAASFGAHTSGTVLFYDAAGALRFAGGITSSRGHEGDSAGGDALRALLDKTAASHSAPIYGCPIQ